MDTLQLVLLSLIQGATEWLPVSSSAHLILFPTLTGLPDQGPLIDAMAHLGSLGAVLIYFHRDVARVLQGLTDLVFGSERDGSRITFESKLLLVIAIATAPGLVLGFILERLDLLESLRDVRVIAASTIGFGLLLWAADSFSAKTRSERSLTLLDAAIIGVSQALAFIPGTSRSGVAMTAVRALGFRRDEAGRLGMLVGVPLIGAVGAYALLKLALGESPNAIAADGTEIPVTLFDGLVVAVMSFLAAWGSVAALMTLLHRTSFLPFVLYRIGLGVFLFVFAF